MFYLILPLLQIMFLLTLELVTIHPSIHPSFHPSIHPFNTYLLSTYCVPGAGVQCLCPHRVDHLMRKINITKLNLNLQILFITSGVYCNKPVVCNLFSQQKMLQDVPMGALGFWQSWDDSGLCTYPCIPAVTRLLSTTNCNRLSHDNTCGNCWKHQGYFHLS